MTIQVTGFTNSLPPFDVYLCDPTNVECFYISGLTTLNPIVYIDTKKYFPNENFLYLKIIDTNGCTNSTVLDCTLA